MKISNVNMKNHMNVIYYILLLIIFKPEGTIGCIENLKNS